jgi:hypothetical protein
MPWAHCFIQAFRHDFDRLNYAFQVAWMTTLPFFVNAHNAPSSSLLGSRLKFDLDLTIDLKQALTLPTTSIKVPTLSS